MSFNLRRDVHKDRHNAWRFRRDAVADAILREAPDLLATQEATLPMLRDLDARLPGYLRVGGAREHWPGEEPNALYYDPGRLRVLDAGVFWLSRRPLRVGSRSWGDWARRSALWAIVLFVETGAPLLVVNTHLDHVSALSRRRSALLLRRVAPEGVMMGDFNARPGGFVHRTLLDGRWDPLEDAAHTHNLFTRRDRGRIDWVLLPEGMRARRAALVHARRPDGGPVSDHVPVAVDVEPPVAEEPLTPPAPAWSGRRDVPTRLPPAPTDVPRRARELAPPRPRRADEAATAI